MQQEKIVIIGAGHVGSHCAYALAHCGVCREIVLTDILPDKAAAQALDVADSVSYLPQTRLDMLGRSIEMLKELTAQLRPLALTCPVVSITNPADIVADYLRKQLSLPRTQCFSTGTLLDTARLIRAIAQAAGTDRRSVSAFSMGEHGDSSMVPFSAVTVGGVPFDRLGLDKSAILTQTRLAGMDIIEGKGSTEFGIGLSLAQLAAAILGDQHRVLPVSVLLEGEYGQQGVHCGVPCRIGRRGIEEIVVLDLTQQEQQQLDASCQVIRKHIALADSL